MLRYTAAIWFALVLIVVVAVLIFTRPSQVAGSAFAGAAAVESIATTTVVGPQSTTTIFSKNATCSARVIGTTGQAVMLLFADPSGGDLSSTTISGAKGFWQAASTTIAYDSGLFGCGRVLAVGYASSTLTVMETQ